MNNEFTYYEIWNNTSERSRDCSEMCTTFEIAQEKLKHLCDWCRPAGTGRIYKIDLIPQDDGTIIKTMNMVMEVR